MLTPWFFLRLPAGVDAQTARRNWIAMMICMMCRLKGSRDYQHGCRSWLSQKRKYIPIAAIFLYSYLIQLMLLFGGEESGNLSACQEAVNVLQDEWVTYQLRGGDVDDRLLAVKAGRSDKPLQVLAPGVPSVVAANRQSEVRMASDECSYHCGGSVSMAWPETDQVPFLHFFEKITF